MASVADRLQIAHDQVKARYGDVWPDTVDEVLDSWARAGMSLREERAEIIRVYGVRVSASKLGQMRRARKRAASRA